jgi:hypothetical protein
LRKIKSEKAKDQVFRNSQKALIARWSIFFSDHVGEGLIIKINLWETPGALIELSARDISALITRPKTKSCSRADRLITQTNHRAMWIFSCLEAADSNK